MLGSELMMEGGEEKEARSPASTGGGTAVERFMDWHVGNSIHLFLSLLAFLILVAAAIAALDTVVRDFPKLWQSTSEYNAPQQIIENILLIAIAADLGLLLAFHRAAAAVEVVIFIIARRMSSQA